MFSSSVIIKRCLPTCKSLPISTRRSSSSEAAASTFATSGNGKQRISLALYRQLLRWCHQTDKHIPLSSFVPPIYMTEPQIDIQRLSSATTVSDDDVGSNIRFPKNSILDRNSITCPIHNSEDAKQFFRAIFRLNQAVSTKNEDVPIQKQRITLAFEAIRSLNTLSQGLHTLKLNRAKHVLRDGITFRIGHVVKHKTENWRGIIIGWERMKPIVADPDDKPTSLTKKQYDVDEIETVQYTVLLDSGDAHLHYSKRRDTSNLSQAKVRQSEIDLVVDNSLLRIRNTQTSQYFKSFDPALNMFIPNGVVAYEYPSDMEVSMSSSDEEQFVSKSDEVALQVVAGVEDMSDHLRRIILDYTSAPESRKLKLLAHFLDRLLKISSGEVLPVKDRLDAEPIPKQKLATAYLKGLISLAEDIGDLLWQRRRNIQSAENMKFSVGDVVKHTEYGFRGVIVAADPEPTVDVSRWDGLQHIKNPEKYPFYHIIPDQDDCIQAFGGERPFRYVCEANLVDCPTTERQIEVDLGPEWDHDATKGIYIPPDDVKFKHGIDLSDDGITKQCLMELRDSLTRTLVAMRDGTSCRHRNLDSVAKKLSVLNLMELLKESQDSDTANIISDCLKEIWRSHPNGDLKFDFDEATNALLNGKTEDALGLFTSLIGEDPNYAEAWNKASTCEFLLGNLEASMAGARKALNILPGHFQAQNGLGLVYFEKKEYGAAIECFRKSLELDPWSPVSARLALCIDTVQKWEKWPGPKI